MFVHIQAQQHTRRLGDGQLGKVGALPSYHVGSRDLTPAIRFDSSAFVWPLRPLSSSRLSFERALLRLTKGADLS